MNRALIGLARGIYRSTPVPALRRLYFAAFCRLMRDRRAIATIDGSTFDLDLGEIIDMSIYLQQYEPEVTAALHAHCRPGMIVLDIGANVGAHALPLARLVGSSGAVYAFEPTDFAFAKLSRNVALNPGAPIRLEQVALADRTAAAQPIAFRSSWRTDGTRADGRSVVDFVRLDDWCRAHGVSAVDLIKIDIDGNEFGALAGGVELIGRSRPTLIMEAVSPHFADPGRNPFALLEQLGYTFRDLRSHERYADAAAIGQRLPADDAGMTTSRNVIASAS